MTLALSSSETVIHYEPLPYGVCVGKDRAAAELQAYRLNPPDACSTYRTMLACWHGNVTCDKCKAYLKANKAQRNRMMGRKANS